LIERNSNLLLDFAKNSEIINKKFIFKKKKAKEILKEIAYNLVVEK
jgi:hypothetical protein